MRKTSESDQKSKGSYLTLETALKTPHHNLYCLNMYKQVPWILQSNTVPARVLSSRRKYHFLRTSTALCHKAVCVGVSPRVTHQNCQPFSQCQSMRIVESSSGTSRCQDAITLTSLLPIPQKHKETSAFLRVVKGNKFIQLIESAQISTQIVTVVLSSANGHFKKCEGPHSSHLLYSRLSRYNISKS